MFDQGYFSVVCQFWIFKNETKVFTFTAFLWLREESQLVCTLGFSGKVLEYCDNYPCSRLLQRSPITLTTSFRCWNRLFSPLPSFCFVLVLGLLALRSILSSQHAPLYHRGLPSAGGGVQWEAGTQREGKLSLPSSKEVLLVTALATPWSQPRTGPLQLQVAYVTMALWIIVTLTLPFVPPKGRGACGLLPLLRLWLTLASPVHLNFSFIGITGFLNEILFMQLNKYLQWLLLSCLDPIHHPLWITLCFLHLRKQNWCLFPLRESCDNGDQNTNHRIAHKI